MSHYDEETLEKFRLSGKILRETREEIKNFVREDMPIIDICEKAEKTIMDKGGKPAFPCNVSINEIAAHYTSPPNDNRKIPRKSIVKVDIGVHVDGYLTDTAVTICFNPEYKSLVDTAEQALKTAINSIHPEMSTSKLGAIIEKTIKSHGFKPISNLTGHQVGRYLVHAGTSLPNVAQLSFSKIKLGEVYAIEPFVTLPDAVGRVEDGEEATIFRFLKSKSLKNPYSKQLLKHIEENFRTLPFAERWLQGIVPKEHHREAFRELLSSKALMGYPIFVEVSRKPVAQAEHTVLIVEDGCVILT
ncbi:type II methionyl aminopeptidase [Candidatus Bathyarchaeota archaeon CG_4_8_14_3_um_filter_42_8]|nr:MAG: type II methionyl aminopeptidase [Candidatus Bathyarchaeota archaeon CG_4_8_14_3_um_filter_42_8]